MQDDKNAQLLIELIVMSSATSYQTNIPHLSVLFSHKKLSGHTPMRRKIPSTTALVGFERAARHQSFTKAAKELSLHRLQVTVSSRNVRAVKWIKSLYFKEEGILKNYGIDKSDYIMFARLF